MIKRLMDIVIASAMLLVLSPVLGGIVLLVRWKLGTPVLFRQERPGRHELPFTMYKFRSMKEKRDATGCLLPDRDRLTPFGAFLRSSSLDELPELINVLKGEMSLVGPRPLLMQYLPYFTETERLRFKVRPGITGLAQVSGRNDLFWDRRLALDVQYVKGQSLGLDIKIMMETVKKVMTRDGVQVSPGDTLRDFDCERREERLFQGSGE